MSLLSYLRLMILFEMTAHDDARSCSTTMARLSCVFSSPEAAFPRCFCLVVSIVHSSPSDWSSLVGVSEGDVGLNTVAERRLS